MRFLPKYRFKLNLTHIFSSHRSYQPDKGRKIRKFTKDSFQNNKSTVACYRMNNGVGLVFHSKAKKVLMLTYLLFGC